MSLTPSGNICYELKTPATGYSYNFTESFAPHRHQLASISVCNSDFMRRHQDSNKLEKLYQKKLTLILAAIESLLINLQKIQVNDNLKCTVHSNKTEQVTKIRDDIIKKQKEKIEMKAVQTYQEKRDFLQQDLRKLYKGINQSLELNDKEKNILYGNRVLRMIFTNPTQQMINQALNIFNRTIGKLSYTNFKFINSEWHFQSPSSVVSHTMFKSSKTSPVNVYETRCWHRL